MGKRRQKLVDALARQLIQENSLTIEHIKAAMEGRNYPLWKKVRGKLGCLTAAELGTVAASGLGYADFVLGRTTLYEVHRRDWLYRYSSGITLLREIAATTVMARMNDLIKSQAHQ